MQRTNVYAAPKELILKGFSNIRKNATLKSGGESGIWFALLPDALDFPDSLGNSERNSKGSRSL